MRSVYRSNVEIYENSIIMPGLLNIKLIVQRVKVYRTKYHNNIIGKQAWYFLILLFASQKLATIGEN